MVQIPGGTRLGDMPSGEPFPEGIYQLRLDKAEYKESAERKTPMAECMLTIVGPQTQEEHHGRKVFENFMLAGEGQFKLRGFLEMTGETEDFVLEDTEQLLEREVGAIITIEKERKETRSGPNQGKLYPAKNKIARFIPFDEVE
jgi:hypothetical protein